MADNWTTGINGDEDDDEALRIAIALSLGQDPEQTRRRGDGGLIDLTGDDDGDGDDNGNAGVDGVDDGDAGVGVGDGGDARPQHLPPPNYPPTSTSAFSALGLDRKKMEEERLARASKRKASQLDDVQPAPRPIQRPKMANSSSLPSVTAPEEKARPAELKAAVSNSIPSRDRLPFPQGVVKKTWAFNQPRHGDDIKIEEVLQKHRLELAVLSSYQWDEEWMLSKIDIARTKLILIAFAADEAQKEEMRSNVPRDRIRFCFPPMQGIGAMHSKLMLLKYEKYLRIVVPTGNLMSFDWGETGTMENMVFIIDLPKFQSAEEREAQTLTSFADELLYFLRAQGLDEKLVASLRNYDFAETGCYRFVHTIPGSHTADDAWRRTGYCGLGQAVSTLGLSSTDPIELDFVCASLGAVNYGLLAALYYACQGDSGLKEYESRTSGAKIKRDAAVDEAVSMVKRHMRIFFPSRQTVLQSKGGRDGAGTICFQAKWWQAATFPRELLRDCKSTRAGVLMHSKVMFIRPTSSSTTKSCFAYVGSANLSESAWGRLVRDRASGKPKLTCRNWECGVLVKVRQDQGRQELQLQKQEEERARHGKSHEGDGDIFGVFRGHVPVPMEWPGRTLSSSASGEGAMGAPWFYQDG